MAKRYLNSKTDVRLTGLLAFNKSIKSILCDLFLLKKMFEVVRFESVPAVVFACEVNLCTLNQKQTENGETTSKKRYSVKMTCMAVRFRLHCEWFLLTFLNCSVPVEVD